MSFARYRHKYPFIRLVIPLAAGICLCECSGALQRGMWATGCFALLLSVLFVLLSLGIKKHTGRWLWGAGIYVFFFSAGMLATGYSSKRVHPDFAKEAYIYSGYVSGRPQEKSRTIACPVRVEERRDSLEKQHCDFRILLYLPKDSLSRQVGWGNKIRFYSPVRPPENARNPDEFDYAAYLFRHGVSGISWVRPGEWETTTGTNKFDLRRTADTFRGKITKKFRDLGFKGNNLAVLSALTLGYKDELTEDVKQAFSISGVSHVLALSGLHIGLIYLLLCFLLSWMDRIKGFRLAKPFLIILFLWAFAFVTGLPPSVIRSTFMFSLVALAAFSGGRSVTLNTLAAAAFFMLLYDPFYLFDVSFQLSFISVAGIVLIQPRLYRKWNPENRFLRYIWGLITVTMAAQVVTAPLVLCYFSQFPVHFLWVNLLVIPLVTLILYLTVGMLLTGWFPALQLLAAGVLERLLDGLNSLTTFVGQLPFSSIPGIYLSKANVAGCYLLLLLGAFYIVRKNKQFLYACLLSVLILTLLYWQDRSAHTVTPSILFYNNRTAPCVHFISSAEKSYLLSVRSDSVKESVRQCASRFWITHRLSEPMVIPDNYANTEIVHHQGIVCFSGKRVCMVKDTRWRNKKSRKPLPLDYLYICRGYKGSVNDLTKVFIARKVVLDSSLSRYRLEKLKKECRSAGLDFISISEKGSFRIEL